MINIWIIPTFIKTINNIKITTNYKNDTGYCKGIWHCSTSNFKQNILKIVNLGRKIITKIEEGKNFCIKWYKKE